MDCLVGYLIQVRVNEDSPWQQYTLPQAVKIRDELNNAIAQINAKEELIAKGKEDE